MSVIGTVLEDATMQLKSCSDTPRLDAEVLMSHVLHVSRTYLYSHSREVLPKKSLDAYKGLLERRLQGEPVAYLVGHKEFWNLDLLVSKDTLIPRPETELLVQLVLSLQLPERDIMLADLGVGCGTIALAIASERPGWHIHATDISDKALAIASRNMKKNALTNVLLQRGSWCQGLPKKNYDIMVSNPPYIAANDPHLFSLGYEPSLALVSGHDGLDAIKVIVDQARHYLSDEGLLFIEHGFEQQPAVIQLMLEFNFQEVEGYVDIAGQPRVVSGLWKK